MGIKLGCVAKFAGAVSIFGLGACTERSSKEHSENEDPGISRGGTEETGADPDTDTGNKPQVFDFGSGGTGEGINSQDSPGCKKVDVVIAVDNSGSMVEEIAALRGPVFDSFPATLLEVGEGLEDFRLAVIDACNQPAAFHNWGTGGSCSFSTGNNYMVSTSEALLDEYSCVMNLTTAGYQGQEDGCSGNDDDEQPANTAATALTQPLLDGTNGSFLRDDAVLFVVAITDEDEQANPARSAQEIADALIDAKGSIDRVVFLGIGGGQPDFCEGAYGTAEPAPILQAVAKVFSDQERGLFWDLCGGSLEEAFAAGLKIVDDACDEFEPIG